MKNILIIVGIVETCNGIKLIKKNKNVEVIK